MLYKLLAEKLLVDVVSGADALDRVRLKCFVLLSNLFLVRPCLEQPSLRVRLLLVRLFFLTLADCLLLPLLQLQFVDFSELSAELLFLNETAVVSVHVILMLKLSLKALLVATEGLHSARIFELKVLSYHF